MCSGEGPAGRCAHIWMAVVTCPALWRGHHRLWLNPKAALALGGGRGLWADSELGSPFPLPWGQVSWASLQWLW